MRPYRIKQIFFYICFLLVLLPTRYAAADYMVPAQWHQLTKDSAFYYRNEIEQAVKPQPKNNFFEKILVGIVEFFSSGIGYLLFWALIIALLGYAVYKIISNERFFLFSKKKKTFPNIDTSPDLSNEDPLTVNWEVRMQEALRNNDMRMVIRYSYIGVLQMLQNKELITYRNDKTNYDYFSELHDTPYKQPFRSLTRQYEYAWYGHYTLSSDLYNNYMDTFKTLKDQLR